MPSFKTYRNINVEKQNQTFAISQMETIYRSRNGKKDDPHRHDYFTVLVVERAKGIHKVDFNTYALGERQVFFVAPGQVHQIVEEEMSKGFVMTFNSQFLVENSIDLSFIHNLNLFQDYGQSPPLQPNEIEFKDLTNFCKKIFSLFHSNKALKNLSIGAYLKLLLIECNTICSLDPNLTNTKNGNNSTILAFKKLVNANYKTNHDASFYASSLHISPDHLNRILKKHIGKTPKAYIQSRIITEAKRLLFFSNLSNKEIAYELGFNEPTNFSAFFKKCTGYSPSKFLESEKK